MRGERALTAPLGPYIGPTRPTRPRPRLEPAPRRAGMDPPALIVADSDDGPGRVGESGGDPPGGAPPSEGPGSRAAGGGRRGRAANRTGDPPPGAGGAPGGFDGREGPREDDGSSHTRASVSRAPPR